MLYTCSMYILHNNQQNNVEVEIWKKVKILKLGGETFSMIPFFSEFQF